MSSHADPIWRLDPDAPSAINSVMQQATLIDYPGKMAALMFTAGCNFRCGYCHNFATLGSPHAKTYSFRQLADILDTFRRQWTSAVTISGVRAPFSVGCHWAATRGSTVARSLNPANAFRPVQ